MKILHCPWCGVIPEPCWLGSDRIVICNEEDCPSIVRGTLEQAIEAWNTRVVEPRKGSILRFVESEIEHIPDDLKLPEGWLNIQVEENVKNAASRHPYMVMLGKINDELKQPEVRNNE